MSSENVRARVDAVTHEELYSCGRRAICFFATKKKKKNTFVSFIFVKSPLFLSFFLSFFLLFSFFLSFSLSLSDDVCSCVSVCVLQRVINTNKGGHAVLYFWSLNSATDRRRPTLPRL